MKIKTVLFGIGAGAILLSTSANAQNMVRETSWMDGDWKGHSHCMNDKEFAHKAYKMNLAEIEMGRLAQEKGTTPAVRAFGEKMVKDHESGNKSLMMANATWGNDWPMKMDAHHQSEYDKLASFSGENFDRNYMIAMKYGHRKAWKMYASCGDHVYDSDLKAYVFETKDAIIAHLALLTANGYDANLYTGSWRGN